MTLTLEYSPAEQAIRSIGDTPGILVIYSHCEDCGEIDGATTAQWMIAPTIEVTKLSHDRVVGPGDHPISKMTAVTIEDAYATADARIVALLIACARQLLDTQMNVLQATGLPHAAAHVATAWDFWVDNFTTGHARLAAINEEAQS